MQLKLETRLVSSLEKVFAGQAPVAMAPSATMLRQDFLAFQLACRFENEGFSLGLRARVEVDTPLRVTVRQVEQMPVRMVSPSTKDGDYISDQPGLYPDLLAPARMGDSFLVNGGQWNAFWIEVETEEGTPAGVYQLPISLILSNPFTKDSVTLTTSLSLTVVDAVLPPQTLKHTEWFHADCVANYYHLPVWSEEHWKMVENQLQLACRRGINMLLTPLFTYPLDTAEGASRTVTQLVDVTVEGEGKYRFGFDNFRRWVQMGQRCGIQWFEMSHLFSQGGAAHSAPIMGMVDGQLRQIFGPADASDGEPYQNFLSQLLPALTAEIEALGIREQVVFHLSDEPQLQHLPLYRKLKEKLMTYLDGYVIMDALSDYDFYRDGVCQHPVVASNHVTPFLEGETPEDFWVYYCVGQYDQVSNRFIAMPSYRNRILGVQLYKYEVDGFLHWGYNFYNSIGSIYPVNPFASTDSGSGFPAGDPFLVYPGDDGQPWPSIRLEVLWEALCDLRALKLLESLTSRKFVMSLIEAEEEVTFFSYPRNAEYLLKLRERVNAEIARHV